MPNMFADQTVGPLVPKQISKLTTPSSLATPRKFAEKRLQLFGKLLHPRISTFQALRSRTCSACGLPPSSRGLSHASKSTRLNDDELEEFEESVRETTCVLVDEVEYIEIGTIVDALGNNGELEVTSTTDFPEERLETAGWRYLKKDVKSDCGPPARVMLTRGERIPRANKGDNVPAYSVSFEGIVKNDMAAALAGHTLLMLRRDDRVLPVDYKDFEYYEKDFLGLRLVDAVDAVAGTVVDYLYGTGPYDTLQVKIEDGPKTGALMHVPFSSAVCPVVDLEKGVIHAELPKGLFELAKVPKPPKQRKKAKRRQRNAAGNSQK
ncbi:hypothetical protein CYMTET_18824 [Cymbomonas tetramitiformis]|uniref:RimM N-terminal domain-containing protein n=1 Tax=Cymbomonas tetramitiformis TaxID=36881 RepID=A0AAE0G7B7_9CHLO|nr:hypothetical protein CYMTET_18824 [Cymbomonas tetramitiformis]